MNTRADAPVEVSADNRHKLTVVPDLRVAVKVGAYSMSNEIRTHMEAIGVGDFTASRTNNISWHIRNIECDCMLCRYFTWVYIYCVYAHVFT